MSNVDKRVVEMQFNNKQFEKDMATTVKSLKNFEKNLEFKNSSKGLESASKSMSKFESKVNNIDLSKFEGSVQNISNRLSTMGAIAFTTIQNLATDAYNTVKNKFASLYETVMGKGMTRALNLEQANFQLKGLLGSAEEVAKVMEDVDYAVSGTAFGLDEAAKVASQLAASNVTAGEYMKTSLRGISGVAAMTSSSYEEIGNIFTRVAGQGKVTAMDLNSIAARGLNAAATLADFLGTTEAEVRDMVSSGVIDFKTFATAMDEAFGEHAKAANETFSGAMSNVKSALGRIGAGFKQPYLKYMRPVLVQLIQNINAIKDSMAPLFETVSFLYERLSIFAVSVLSNYVEFRKEGEKEIATISSLKNVFQKLHDFVTRNWGNVSKVINSVTRVVIELLKIVKTLFGIARAVLPNLIEGFLSLSDSIDTISKNGSGFIGFITTIRNILESIRAGLVKSNSSIKSIFTSIFGIIGDVFGVLLKVISLIFGSFDNLTDNGTVLYNLVSALLSLLSFGLGVIKKVTGFIRNIVDLTSPLIRGIVSLTTKFAGFITALTTSAFNKFLTWIISLINRFTSLNISIGNFKDLFENFKKLIVTTFGAGINVASGWLDWLGSRLDMLKNGFNLSGDSAEKSGSKIDKYKEKVKAAGTTISETVKKNSFLKNVWENVANFFRVIGTNIRNGFVFIRDKIQNSGIFETISETFSKIVSKIKQGLSHLFESVSNRGATFTLFDWIKGFIRAVIDLAKDIITNLEPAKEAILKMFGANSILDLLQRFVSMYATLNVSNALSSFVRSLQSFVVGINGPIQMIMRNFRTNTTNALRSFAKAVLMLSISIFILSRIDSETLILTASILTGFLFAFTEIVKAMDKSFQNSKNTSSSILSMSLMMRTLGKSVRDVMLAMTVIMIVINNIKPESVWLSIAVISVITILIGAFITMFARFAKSSLKPAQILSFSVLIKAISSAIKGIAIVIGILSLFDKEKVNNASIIVGSIIILMGAFISLFALIPKSGLRPTQILSFSLLVKSMGSAIKGIAVVIGILSLFDKEKVNNSANTVKSLILLYSGLLGVFSVVGTNMRPTQILSFSLLVKSMGSAIKGIAVVIGILSLLTPTKLLTSLAVVSIITTIISGLMVLTNFINGNNLNQSSKSILIIASAIAIFSLAIIKLSKVDLLTLLGTVAILTTSILILGGAMVGLSVFSAQLQALSLAFLTFGVAAAAFGAGVYLIAKSVQILTKLGPNAIQLMTDAITALVSNAPKWIVMFVTGFIDAISQMVPSIAKSLINVIVTIIQVMAQSAGTIVSAIVGLFKSIVTSLTAYRDAFKIEDLFWAIQAVALIAGLIYVLQVISSDMKSALKGIALMAIVLGAVVGALVILNQFTNVEKTVELIKGLSIAILSLAGVFAIIGIVSTLMTRIAGPQGTIIGLLIGIVGFVVFIIAMVATFGAIGAIINAIGDDAIAAFDTAVTVMQKIGQALGNFFGTIVSAFSGIISNSNISESTLLAIVPIILALEPLTLALPILTAFIVGIGAVMNSLDEAFNGAATNSLEKAIEIMPLIGEAIGGFIGSLAGAAIKFISKGLAAAFTTFADSLSEFMSKLQPFINSLKTINGDLLERSGQLVLIILEMCAAELITGITRFFSIFTDGPSLVEFASMLSDMAPYLVNFSKKLTEGNFNGDTAQKAANCALMMSKVMQNLPRENGVVQWWAGTAMNMDTFGQNLEGFAVSLNNFAKNTSHISPEQVDKITALLPMVETLVDIANAMPKDDGIWQKIAGTLTDMDDFGEQIAKLGVSLNDLAANTSHISGDQIETIKKLVPIISDLVEIGNGLSDTGGVWQLEFGEKMNLEQFGSHVASMGESLQKFAVSTSKISSGNIASSENALKILSSMVGISSTVANNNMGNNWFINMATGGMDIEAFSTKLPKIGEALAGFAEKTKDIPSQYNARTAAEAVQAIAVGFSSITTNGNVDDVKKFIEYLNKLVGDEYDGILIKAADLLGDDNGIAQKAQLRAQAVGNALKYISEGLSSISDEGDLTTRIQNFMSSLQSFIDNKHNFIQFIGTFGTKTEANAAKERATLLGDIIGSYNSALKNITDVSPDNVKKFMECVALLEGSSGESLNFTYTRQTLGWFSTILGNDPSTAKERISIVTQALDDISNSFKRMDGINTDKVKNFTEAVTGIANLSIDTIVAGFDSRMQEAVDAAGKLIDEILAGFAQKEGTIKISVAAIVLIISKAFSDNKNDAASGMRNVMDACIDTMNSYNQQNDSGAFYNAGSDAVAGYVKGIESNIQKAIDAGVLIGQKSLEGARSQRALNEHSPSKAFGEIAYFGVLGLVNEFAARASMAFTAGQNLGTSAMEGTKSIVANISDIINSDMDLQPVIRPVLDLSDINSQSGLIGGMLNAGGSYQLAGRTAALIEQNRADRRNARINQNGSRDVVNAVNNLTLRMDSLEKAIIDRPIVMDGVKVTKQIAPSMDRELGQRRYYSRRGN